MCRSLYRELSHKSKVIPIVYDPFAKRFRTLDQQELKVLARNDPSSANGKRGAKWSLTQKIKGRLKRFSYGEDFDALSKIKAILVPEIIGAAVPIEAYLDLKEKTNAPLHAIFHDAIALRMPEITPRKTVAYFPEYLSKLAQFDKIAAVSHSSQNELLHFWKKLGLHSQTKVSTIPLGIKTPDLPLTDMEASNSKQISEHKILFVGSIEGRKNHLEALKAVESLWEKGKRFSIELIGSSVSETASDALVLIDKLIAQGRPIRHLGSVSQEDLNTAYQRCNFTLYPSLFEGFGLPPLESISYGKPCVCTDRGGLADSVKEGGCLVLEETSASAIEQALAQMIDDAALFRKLEAEAKNRNARSWKDYSSDIEMWIGEC